MSTTRTCRASSTGRCPTSHRNCRLPDRRARDGMVSPYLMLPGATPRDLLKRLEAEAPHMARLAESARMWTAAAKLIDDAVQNLADRKTMVLQAWQDAAADKFETSVHKDLQAMA